MINFKKLSNKEKYIRYSNMKARCEKKYQERNPRYEGTFMCQGWLKHRKTTFFVWLDNNYYEVEGEQMDIDKDILHYGNKQYHPELCLIVPHSINVFYETIEVGKNNIKYSYKTKTYCVKVCDKGEYITVNNIDTYNRALDIYCDIKQNILVNKANELKEQIPDKLFSALIHTNIKTINEKYYKCGREEKKQFGKR